MLQKLGMCCLSVLLVESVPDEQLSVQEKHIVLSNLACKSHFLINIIYRLPEEISTLGRGLRKTRRYLLRLLPKFAKEREGSLIATSPDFRERILSSN